ncbi:MAG: LamG domain-containing protein [Micromonosporaceae bacterium]
MAFDAIKGVKYATSHSYKTTALGLRAGNESQANTSWKRFRNDAILSISYNTVPAKPTSLRTTSPLTTCVAGDSPPVIPNDPPILVARLNDADGAKGQKVKGRFYLSVKGGSLVGTYDTAYKLPGVDFTMQAPQLSDGVYSWRLRTYDGVDWGPYSQWCDFRVDSRRPQTPTIATPDGQTYRYGDEATFTFGPGGSTDVTKYRYSFMSDAATSGEVPADSPSIARRMWFFGPNNLRVWSYDAAGNVSDPPGSLEFAVAGGDPRTQWRLDEGQGTSTADAIYGDTLPLSAGCDWAPGVWNDDDPLDMALAFDGVDGVAARSGGLLWMNQNFSVAAWIRVADASARRVAVSQDGSGYAGSGFSIGVSPDPDPAIDQGNIEFRLRNPASATEEAVVSAPGVVDEWVHVTAVYESTTQLMTLYVGGEYAASVNASFTGVEWASSFVLGRGRSGTSPAYFWKGDIDEVRTYRGTLAVEQVRQIANEPRP